MDEPDMGRPHVEHILWAGVENSILRIAKAAGGSLQSDRRERVGLQLRIVLGESFGHQCVLAAKGERAECLRTDACVSRTLERLTRAAGIAGGNLGCRRSAVICDQ